MVLGKLAVPGRPTDLYTSRARPIALAVGAVRLFGHPPPPSIQFSLISPSLWKAAREILSQRAVKTKTTNQPNLFIIVL